MVSTHLKNMSQIGSFLQVGVKMKNIWNHRLVVFNKPIMYLEITLCSVMLQGLHLQVFFCRLTSGGTNRPICASKEGLGNHYNPV